MTVHSVSVMEALTTAPDGTIPVHIEKGLEVRLAPTPSSSALTVRAPVLAYHVPEGVHWGKIVSEKAVGEGLHTEVVCMHIDLELVLYNHLGQLADGADSIQHAYDRALADIELNSDEADQERTTIQVAASKALDDLQIRLDSAVEARDVAVAAELAALQGLTAKRDDYEALQQRKMVADEELLKQASLLERVTNISTMYEHQTKDLMGKVQAGEQREEVLHKKIEEAKAQTKHYHDLSLQSQGDAVSQEDLATQLASRNRMLASLKSKLSAMQEEVKNLKDSHTLKRDAFKKEKDDMAYELKKAESRALTVDIRVGCAVKEAVEKARAELGAEPMQGGVCEEEGSSPST